MAKILFDPYASGMSWMRFNTEEEWSTYRDGFTQGQNVPSNNPRIFPCIMVFQYSVVRKMINSPNEFACFFLNDFVISD